MAIDKRIIIIGATSGIGYEVARLYQQQGWRVGAAGRRMEKLELLRQQAPGRTEIQELDITRPEAPGLLQALIDKLGGMDVFLLSSGVGNQNRSLESEIELNTVQTNVYGFTQMVIAAFRYFRTQKGGQLAIISSIAGTKGIGVAPSYSATKRYQNTYLDALAQLAHMEKLPICFTDIRPGFVKTDLLKNDKYPLLMNPEQVARKIVKAIRQKRRRIVIDWRYAILVFFWKLIPPAIWQRLSIHN